MLGPGCTVCRGLWWQRLPWLPGVVVGLLVPATSCGPKNGDTGQDSASSPSGEGVICLDYSLEDVVLPEETDFWALRTPETPNGRARLDDWSRGEPCAGAGDSGACLERLDETWTVDRGWGYQGAGVRSFMVTTQADQMTRVDSNGSLMGLFGALDQAEKMLFYVGALGYVPRCSTVEQDEDGTWRVEVDLLTSICPHIEQHQSIQIRQDGTLHTLAVIDTIRRDDCRRQAPDSACASYGDADCVGVAAGLQGVR